MVKLGSSLCKKLDKEQGTSSGDDSFDNIPLLTPLDVNQLQQPFPDKLTGLILITMAFLACLLMLVMYKALWYDQLSCPEGFVFKHKHCTPSTLEMYYSEQEVGPQGSLYTAINHLNQGKKTIPELPSPWLPVINALKKSEKGKEDLAGIQQ
uniref:Calcyon neuron specific vesicular protein n=1 Tax=Chelonoidis abingdonii TaxID=106734 RepID=A0A8C0H6L0_CHEAB